MSIVKIEALKIDIIEPHPNADKLDVITVGGYKVCEPKGLHSVGDVVAYFPPDILIPEKIAAQLGVANYLKSAVYPGDFKKSKCMVGAIRLRGVPSFGFIFKVDVPVGTDLTERFHGVKYEPPEPLWYRTGLQASGDVRFHTYTDIQNYRKYPNAIPIGEEIRITEKIHGTNSRIGLIGGQIFCGSHKSVYKEKDKLGRISVYWNPLTSQIKAMLSCISNGSKNVIVFGEIYGSKVQFMDYGIQGNTGYAVFDISVDGEYLPWAEIVYYTTRFCIPRVPLLYQGPFSRGLVEKFVDGPTTVCEIVKSVFKGREGLVLTPMNEQYSDLLQGRLILKAISVDYLANRKSDSH